MFSDEYKPGTTVKSSWKSNRKQRENGSQTSEILTYEVDTQTIPPQDSECQTVPLEELLQKSMTSQVNYNESTLARFLSDVEPMITKQLEKNSAFNVFEETNWGTDNDSDISIVSEYCLQESSVKSETKNDENSLEVTGVAWNSTGGSVAVAYGSMKHMAWGQSKSYLCIWNIDRPRLNQFKCDQKMEVESGIQAVLFHPKNPALIAAGLFSGVVLLWDLSQDEVVYSTESHEDPVTSICWLEPQSHKYLNLLSASTDGRLIVWNQRVSRSKKPLEATKKFKIRASSVRSSTGARGGIGSVGITCCAIAVSVKDGIELTVGDERTLIAGCENGAIVKCEVSEDNPEDDPVKFAYKGHLGPVYTIDWSPFHRHIFLTCSTDQRCRFYHALHASPLREVTPYSGSDQYLYSARWSPARAMTLFSAGGSGTLTAYDANEQYVINAAESEGDDGKKSRINCVEVNRKRLQYIATGNADGIVHVWQLGSKFISTDLEAIDRLKDMAEQAMTED